MRWRAIWRQFWQMCRSYVFSRLSARCGDLADLFIWLSGRLVALAAADIPSPTPDHSWSDPEYQRQRRVGLEYARHFVGARNGDVIQACKLFDNKAWQDQTTDVLLRNLGINYLVRIAKTERGQA